MTEDNFDETQRAIRQAEAIRAVASIRQRAAEQGLDKMSLDEINEIIRDVRSRKQ